MSVEVARARGADRLHNDPLPPTRADAQRVADAFALDPNVIQVLLFGSVAEGTQHAYSDIDLVVVHSDIDYGQREDLGWALIEVGEQLVDAEVDVHPTDLPEWSIRKKSVANSLESRLNRNPLIPLIDRPVDHSAVNWEKEQVMATDSLSNAVEALCEGVGDEIDHLAQLVRVDDAQRAHQQRRRRGQVARWNRTTAAAALVLELSIKSLALLVEGHCISEGRLRRAGHSIDACLKLLAQPYQRLFTELTIEHGIDIGNTKKWRSIIYAAIRRFFKRRRVPPATGAQADAYVRTAIDVSDAVIEEFKQRVEGQTPDQLTAAAVAVADVVLDEFEHLANGDEMVASTRQSWEFLLRAYEAVDVRTGEVREVPLDLAPMLEAQRRRVREALSSEASGDAGTTAEKHPQTSNGISSNGTAGAA